MSQVTIVMYHYVRDLARSRFPAIKARTVDEFDRQLDHIAENYQVVGAEDVLALVSDPTSIKGIWPSNAMWLTFDDGFADHYQTVLPRLHDRKWEGSFYVPQAVTTGIVLDVHKIHFILSSMPMDMIVDEIQVFMEDHQSGCDMVFETCWEMYTSQKWMESEHWIDDKTVTFIKTMLQTVLPQPYRSQLVSKLFSDYVTEHERDFAAELYMTTEQMRMMARMGHHFGNHGVTHEWLKPLSSVDRQREIAGGISFLTSIASPLPRWGMCYPSNEYDADLLQMVGNFGAAYGLTANAGVADLSQHSMLELPRLDTNDLPH